MSKKRNNKTNYTKELFAIVIFIIVLLVGTYFSSDAEHSNTQNTSSTNNSIVTGNNTTKNISIDDIPEYTDKAYIELNNNKPYFEEEDKTTKAFEKYSDLDSKGRCGVAYANICKEIMPENGQKRESISKVKPTGWEQTKVNGEYIYNRCHLIGYQLAAENANEKNLITGTRYFNVEGMLPFENKVAEYIEKNKNNHVLYRVTPIFKDENLLASGVQMEAYSVEDEGKGTCYNVFVYNAQPGVSIDYTTGKIK